jgi:hypothetical protein
MSPNNCVEKRYMYLCLYGSKLKQFCSINSINALCDNTLSMLDVLVVALELARCDNTLSMLARTAADLEHTY